MPKLLIANVNTESVLSDPSVVTYEFACSSAITAQKHAWFADPGDIVVLPEPPSPEMKRYIEAIKGWSPGEAVTFVAPQRSPSDIRLLGFDCLNDGALPSHLKDLMGSPNRWSLMPYLFDRSIASLAIRLGLETRPETEAFRLSGGHELFNDKRVFRSLAAGRGVSLARGETCSSPVQLEGAFDRLMDETGALIVKRSRQGNCLGNLVVATSKGVDGQGAADVLYISDRWPFERAAQTVWKRLGAGTDAHLVVEAYHPVSAVCYAEFEIRADSRSPVFLNWGEQRMEPVFVGFDIPGTMPPYQAARFVSGATTLAHLAQDLGFLGVLDIDGIVTQSGDVLFSEINGRFGGCSHVHYLAEHLLGPGYGDRAAVLTRNKVPAPLFRDVLTFLEAERLSFSAAEGEGIVITGEDTTRTGTLSYMVLAASRGRALELEGRFTDYLRLTALTAPRSVGAREAPSLCH